jgi:hypothetical protein
VILCFDELVSLTQLRPEYPFADPIVGAEGLLPPLFAHLMLHWLANIISSHTFADLATVDEVFALRPPKDGNFRVLEWAEDARERPVFPEWSSKGLNTGPKGSDPNISTTEIKPKNPKGWVAQFSDRGRRTGFTAEHLGLHASRSEALIKVNG